MNNNYSFYGSEPTTPSTPMGVRATRTETGFQPASKSQIAQYMQQVKKKGITPIDVSKVSYQEMFKILDDLYRYFPISEAQTNKIYELCHEMHQGIMRIKEFAEAGGKEYPEHLQFIKKLGPDGMPTHDFVASLTGGQGGTASQFIAELVQARTRISEILPPTEQQVQLIVQMWPCMDVDFSTIDIEGRVYYDYYVGDQLAYRRMTADEIAAEVFAKLNKQQASDFITRFKPYFDAWQKTRINDTQIRIINNLERSLANISRIQSTGEAVSLEEVDHVHVYVKRERDWNPQAYNISTREQLMALSYQDADKVISQLQQELRIKEKYGGPSIEDPDDQRRLDNKFHQYTDEWAELNNVMHRLCAVAGEVDDKLINTCLGLFDQNQSTEYTMDCAKYIRSFMRRLVIDDYISIDGFMQLIDPSQTAKEIFFEVYGRR